MGLLDQTTRKTLEGLLLRLPNIGDRATRQLLIQDLPPELQHALDTSEIPALFIPRLIAMLESDQLEDERWPIIVVIDRAIQMAPAGFKTHAELKKLRAGLGGAATGAGARQEESQASAPALIGARRRVRRPPPDFTGREEALRELAAALVPGETARVVTLHGMGGAGKSVLALKLVELVKAHYPETIIDVEDLQPGGEPLPTEALMGAVIRVFQPEARLPDDRAGVGALYLEVTEGRRALLLLDNAVSAVQVEPLLDLSAGWGVVVTSRAKLGLRGAHDRDVDALAPDEAVTLLRQLLPRGLATDAELGRLASACGRLPLALVVAAGVIRKWSWPIGEFTNRVAAEPLRHLVGEDESQSVARVLGTSVTRLRRQNAKLAGRWTLLGVFPAPFDRDAAAAVWATGGDAARRALGRLVSASLVDHDRQEDRYRLHDLLRAYAQGEAGTGLDDARRRHARHYLTVGGQADDLFLSGEDGVLEGLRRFDAAWPHLRAAWEWMRSLADKEARIWVAAMPLRMPHVLDLRLTPRERIPLLEVALATAQAGSDRRGEGGALTNLGGVYAELGDARRAIEFSQQALILDREIGDRRGEGITLGNLGVAYFALGEPRRAIEFSQQALVIDREIGYRRGVGNMLGNLGLAYANLGEPRRAIEYYEQALVIDREIGYRRGVGMGLGNLGRAHAMLGGERRAIEFCEQSLAIMRELEDRRFEGYALNFLGFAHVAAGDAARAMALHEQALDIIRRVGDKSAEGRFLVDLGEARHALGETDAAVAALREALEIAERLGDRWSEARASWLLGTIAAETGHTSAAAELMAVAVAYEQEIGHADAEAHAARLEDVRRQAAGETAD